MEAGLAEAELAEAKAEQSPEIQKNYNYFRESLILSISDNIFCRGSVRFRVGIVKI